MHPLFKKTKNVRISLDNDFYITPDPYNGLILCREVLKEKKDKEGKTVFYNDVTKKYLEGSTWSFVPNNNSGIYSIVGDNCSNGDRNFIFTIQ